MRWLWLVWVAACGSDPTPQTTPLASDGTHLRDSEGRIALLHGVNARIAGVFDVTFDDGRTALEPIPALSDFDCQRMRALGFDFLRLPINWSGIEPVMGSYDDAYLANVDAAVQCAAHAGISVMIDLHEDAYSKEIGEDGAPLWAIQPAPVALLQGPLDDLGARRTSAQVTAAFNTFFDRADPARVRAKFLAMLDLVAARWATDPAVIGFELFNEPPVGDTLVTPFSFEAAARVRAAAPNKLVMFEPSATRNLFDFAPKSMVPFPTRDAVYAPHIYTYVFSSDQTQLENLTPDALEPSVQAARAEATSWSTPLMIGEYGVGPDQANADLWMGVQQQLHDRYLASDAFWVWKEDSQAAWGLYDHAGDDTWTERPRIVAWVSRIHAARIAGTVTANEFDYTTGALHLEAYNSNAPHEIYIPERSATTFAATCDGVALSATRDLATGLIDVTCDGMLDVMP
jgi:endoglycosylceramidase